MGKMETGIEKSEFNMGIAILVRIDNLLTAASIFSQRRLLDEWYNTLLPLAGEVEYSFEPEERKINNDFKKKINPLHQKYLIHRSKNKIYSFEEFGGFYDLLRNYENFIRKAMDKRKILLKAQEESQLF